MKKIFKKLPVGISTGLLSVALIGPQVFAYETGSVANVVTEVNINKLSLQDYETNIFDMDYTVLFAIPEGTVSGDTIGISTLNLNGLIPTSESTMPIEVDGVQVGNIMRVGYDSYVAKQKDPKTNVKAKKDLNLKAGTGSEDYIITFNKAVINHIGKKVNLRVANEGVMATSVNADTTVAGKVFVNNKEVFSRDYTIKKSELDNIQDLNKTYLKSFNTHVVLGDKGINDYNLGFVLSPLGYDLDTGSKIHIKLPKDSMMRFEMSGAQKVSEYVTHFPKITEDVETSSENVILQNYDRVQFEVDYVTDDEIVLYVKEGTIKNNDKYVINSDHIGVTFKLKSESINKIDGDKIGPEELTTTVVTSDGRQKLTIGNEMVVNVLGGTLTEAIVKYSNDNSHVTRYVDEEGNDLRDPVVKGGDFKDAGYMTIKGYDYVKKSFDRHSTVHMYRKKPMLPRGIKLTEFVDEYGMTIADSKTGKTTSPYVMIDGFTFSNTKDTEYGVVHIYSRNPKKHVLTKFLEYGTNKELKEVVESIDMAMAEDINGYVYSNSVTDVYGNTTHIYKRQSHDHKREVTTMWVDEDGKALKDTMVMAELVPAGEIEGYEYKETIRDENETLIKHVFTKVTVVDTTETKVITKFVDTKGVEISNSMRGMEAADKKELDGYEFIETVVKSNSEVHHVYKKKNQITVSFVDEKGNKIEKSIAVDSVSDEKPAVEGYEYVKSEKDDNGNVKHIFKKQESTKEFVTDFVDESGAKLKDSITSNKLEQAVEVDGYKFKETVKISDKHHKHIYKKLTKEELKAQGKSDKNTKNKPKLGIKDNKTNKTNKTSTKEADKKPDKKADKKADIKTGINATMGVGLMGAVASVIGLVSYGIKKSLGKNKDEE